MRNVSEEISLGFLLIRLGLRVAFYNFDKVYATAIHTWAMSENKLVGESHSIHTYVEMGFILISVLYFQT